MILQGKKIVKSFQHGTSQTQLLRSIDIEVNEGEFVAIMGKSGSGKSTLLNILATLESLDGGEVYFEGQRIDQLSSEKAAQLRRSQFGFVFQQPHLLKNLTIEDNILLPSIEYETDRVQAKQRAHNLMGQVGLDSFAKQRTSQLSGGQLQRAGICRALINCPRLLFADEATGALDSQTEQEVLALFAQLKQEGTTIVMVTHDAQVAACADRVLFMKDGIFYQQIKPFGTLEEKIRSIEESSYQI